MRDADSIEFIGDQRTGRGTRMKVKTIVGPFRTMDEMLVTGWEEGRSITVEHRGLVRGTGTFTVIGDSTSSEVRWDEELAFPWWLGGELTAWVARPVLARIWKGNLKRLDAALTDL